MDVNQDLRGLVRSFRLGPRLRFIRRRFWRRWDELIFAFGVENLRIPTARLPVTFKVLAEDSLESDADLPELELVPRHEVLARLRRGHFCVAAILEGRAIQYCWMGTGSWSLDDIGIVAALAPDELFIYDVYASENARGNRIFLALIGQASDYGIKRGFRTFYTRIRRRNVAALVGPKFFGFAERLELNSMRIFSFLRVYHAVLVKGSGRTLNLLTGERTRMGTGVLIWRAEGRTGYRINLPLGRTIMPEPRVPLPNGKS